MAGASATNSMLDDASSRDLHDQIMNASQKLQQVKDIVTHFVVGQDHAVEMCLNTAVAGGHILLESAPGLAKTTLAVCLSKTFGVQVERTQGTPDLMPNDILGSYMAQFDEQDEKQNIRFVKGPVFTDIHLFDEINRATPKVQSALLQAMQERKVIIQGREHKLSPLYRVLATQNPLDQEGALPLPEAQLDRFMVRLQMKNIKPEEEFQILFNTSSESFKQEIDSLNPVLSEDRSQMHDLIHFQELSEKIIVSQELGMFIIALQNLTRPDYVAETGSISDMFKGAVQGCRAGADGMRAGQAILKLSRANALLNGRVTVEKQDILSVLEPALLHRLQFKRGADIKQFIELLPQEADAHTAQLIKTL